MLKRPKIGIVSLTACNGCQVEILNEAGKFLNLLDFVEIGNFPLVEDEKARAKFDIVFVEGSPVTRENFQYLKDLRKRTKYLVALGTCACLGGIPKLKNYARSLEEKARYVYKNIKRIANPKIQPLKEVVKVDAELAGCPSSSQEFLQFIYENLVGRPFKIPERPVCHECQIGKYRCLLLEGKACLGPLVLGGCQAVCLRSNYPCEGCRGLLKGASLANYLKIIKKHKIKLSKLLNILEKFGLKEEVQKLIKEKVPKK